jgi:hypothetical protein
MIVHRFQGIQYNIVIDWFGKLSPILLILGKLSPSYKNEIGKLSPMYKN